MYFHLFAVSLRQLGSKVIAGEAEFAFRIARALPSPPGGAELSEEDVWACVESVSCSIEVALSRFSGPLTPSVVVA